MKICNCGIYKFIIICLLQTSNLHAFQLSIQNTEKSSETIDIIKLNTASNTTKREFDEKSSSKNFIVQKREPLPERGVCRRSSQSRVDWRQFFFTVFFILKKGRFCGNSFCRAKGRQKEA